MCGIIGIIDKEQPVFKRAFFAIKALQNRGEDACGIATSDQGSIFLKKDLGLAKNIFKPKDSSLLRGNMAIGHNRYATQGKELLDDAQPLCKSNIAFALNGNIVNYFGLKKIMAWKEIKLNTSVDTEVMLHIFEAEYKKTANFFLAAKKMMRKVRGGYSVVGLVAGKGIFAVRDPNGIRPLVLGRKKDSYIISSETKALDTLGYSFVREIKPGEALTISKNLKINSKIIKQRRKTFCMFESVYFANEDSRINNRLIKNIRKEIGGLLAKKVRKEKIDFVVPVPNTGKPAAMQLASELKVPYKEIIIKNDKINRTFILPSQQVRSDAIKLKFSLKADDISGKSIALVDDSLVRGTTAMRLIKVLKKAGAAKVVFVSTCPKIKYPCFYGINMSIKKELIGSRRTTKKIQSLIEADKLIYLSVRSLKKALGREICTACLTGDYPVRISLYEKIALANQRAMQDKAYSTKYNQILTALGKIETKSVRQVKAGLDTVGVTKMAHYLKRSYEFVKKRKII